MFAALVVCAAAQEGFDAPVINAQNLRLTVDGEGFHGVDMASAAEGAPLSLRGLAGFAWRPLVVEDIDTGERWDLLRDLGHLDVLAGYQVSLVRVGVHLPLMAGSGSGGAAGGLGDVAADLRITALDGRRTPVGLAVAGRLILPTSTFRTLPLRTGGLGWEASAILDLRQDSYTIALNVVAEGGPRRNLERAVWSTRLGARLGAAIELVPDTEIRLEVDVMASIRDPGGAGAGVPAEGLVGVVHQLSPGLRLQGAVGAGLSRGVGVPAARVLFGVAWTTPTRRPVRSARRSFTSTQRQQDRTRVPAARGEARS